MEAAAPGTVADRMSALASAAAGVVRATTEDDLFAVLRESCARVLPFDAVTFGLYDPGAGTLRFLEALDQGEPVEPAVVSVAGTPAESVICDRRPLLTLSAADPRSEGSRLMGTGRRSESIIRCPILAEDEVLGVISVQSYERDAYDADDVEVVEILAANAATALLNLRYRRHLAELVEEERRTRAALALSEERHRALLEHSHDVTVVVDRDGRMSYVSPSSTRVLGFEPAELVGRSVSEVIVPLERARAERSFRKRLDGGLAEGLHLYTLQRKDGAIRTLEVVGRDLLHHPGVEGVVYNARDVTDRREAESRVEEALRRLQAAQAMANVGDWEYDLDEGTVTWSEQLYRIYGIPLGQPVTYETFMGLVHPDDRERVDATVEAARTQGGWYSVDHRVIRPDGVVRHIHGRGLYAFGPDGELARVFGTSQDVTELRQAEEALRSSQERLRLFLSQMPALLWITDTELRFTWADGAGLRRVGVTDSPPVGMTLAEYFGGGETAMAGPIRMHRRALEGERVSYEFTWKEFTFEAYVEPLRAGDGGVIGTLGFALDVTDRRLLERQLREAQRMEAIGRLAGGVAHDFNNILTVIEGHANLLLDELGEGDSAREDVEEMRRAAGRASALTRQLLAFSRRQVLKPRVTDLNRSVREMHRMLQRLIGEDIRLRTELAPDLGLVEVDPAQLEQVLMNLAVNARDAMPGGGTLTITTRDSRIDAAFARQFSYPVRPGEYVRIDVGDTGHGMVSDVAQRAFEPFFTTKPEGLGTGLGLATVYGIVKQSGGYVWVHSEPDAGTRVEIRLPRVQRGGAPDARADAEGPVRGGRETILLVEDEDPVRALARRILERRGYRVLEARHGGEALRICERHHGPIELILTDVVMPQMSGTELVARLETVAPGLRPLYMSGYTEDEVLRRGIVTDSVPFIEKPFTPDGLARKVREVLDSVERGA